MSSSPIPSTLSADDHTPQDDVGLELSQSALHALNEFLAESQAAAEDAQTDPFAENWALSQVSFALASLQP
jgi:hypothetical protein